MYIYIYHSMSLESQCSTPCVEIPRCSMVFTPPIWTSNWLCPKFRSQFRLNTVCSQWNSSSIWEKPESFLQINCMYPVDNSNEAFPVEQKEQFTDAEHNREPFFKDIQSWCTTNLELHWHCPHSCCVLCYAQYSEKIRFRNPIPFTFTTIDVLIESQGWVLDQPWLLSKFT